ncbi:DUF6197 family protein [Muriicola soli]|uniref:Uncharacterized protein n=1 Tax=Muriicola soli TaxID=2507538 RepID=A0A411E8U7_9FLAO|nr:DUF6090 family protein [Muriicola soli]QBA63997.1 hypothetical protein EQY75_05270 [Muriicola soli]
MIKFFRRIRQDLLSEGRTSKYLKYAIGEVVLVMIGILLALQVNEWNKERNRKIAEQAIIEQLISDLSKSQYELEEVREINIRRARECAQVLRAFWKNDMPEDIEEYIGGFGSSVYSPVMGTSRSLINSGRLDILSSNKLRNDIVVYLEAVDYTLKDISRYEESYFRKGVDLMYEANPNTFETKQEINEKSVTESPGWQYGLNINSRPLIVDKVPFRKDIEQLLQDEKYFRAYNKLHLYHRNIALRYHRILGRTNNLLVELYRASEKHPDLGELLNGSEHYLVFDKTDLEILEQADALLNESSKWNRKDDSDCDENSNSDKYSLRCALRKATQDVTGQWQNDPLKPAIRLVLFTIKEYENRRVIESPFRDWNNHPDTTFEDVKQVLRESIEEVKKQLQ